MFNPFTGIILPFFYISYATCLDNSTINLPPANNVEDISFTASFRYRQHTAALINLLTGPKSGYEKNVIPAAPCSVGSETNASNTVCPFVVHCRLYLIRVQEIIENDETLVTTARLQLSWSDLALQWDPAEHGGIREIIIPPRSIWQPDLQIANSVGDVVGLFHDEIYSLRVTYEGRVWYHPNGKFATRCALDLTFYPYDYQKCSFVLESLIYTSEELMTVVRPDKPDPVSTGMLAENPTWILIDAHAFPALYRTGKTTTFSRVHFWMILKRKSDYYQRTMITPLILLSIIQTLTYLTPMQFIDRVPQATVVLLTAFFFQGSMAAELPRSATESFVQTYLNLILAMSVFNISLCTLTIELVQPDEGLPLWGLPRVFSKRFSRKSLPPPEKVKPKKMELSRKKAHAIAAAVNWFGFLVNASASIVYPSVMFVGLRVKSDAPAMPQPTPDNITTSYYAEY